MHSEQFIPCAIEMVLQ